MKHIKNSLVLGTLILTATGLISRIIGFFYRIFISHAFGEEGMGIFQLIAPIMAFSFSLCCAGVQTAISKYVASETTTHDYKSSARILMVSFCLTITLSVCVSTLVYTKSQFIAENIILEVRTAPLLRILALSFPFSAIHCCVNGYFYGIKNAKIPALLQLTEQIFRVLSVYLVYYYFLQHNMEPTISLAVIGVVIGELSSMIISFCFILTRFYKLETKKLLRKSIPSSTLSTKKWLQKIVMMAAPLSANRIVVNFLQSIEAIYIPHRLQQYGLSQAEALSVYGVLTGMALSLILFPSTLTNSVSVLLLPVVSEADENNNKHTISIAIKKSITYCSILGASCTLIFLFFGQLAGEVLFNSAMAGKFIVGLSFICPFLYITTTLGSILHGLGKTFLTFLINIGSLSIRIASIFILIPQIGISGYLIGLLISQLFSTISCIICLRKYRMY